MVPVPQWMVLSVAWLPRTARGKNEVSKGHTSWTVNACYISILNYVLFRVSAGSSAYALPPGMAFPSMVADYFGIRTWKIAWELLHDATYVVLKETQEINAASSQYQSAQWMACYRVCGHDVKQRPVKPFWPSEWNIIYWNEYNNTESEGLAVDCTLGMCRIKEPEEDQRHGACHRYLLQLPSTTVGWMGYIRVCILAPVCLTLIAFHQNLRSIDALADIHNNGQA